MNWGSWIGLSSVALGLTIAACSSSDSSGGGSTATGGSAGASTGGSSGAATGGSGGVATGGSAGAATGGAGGVATGGSSGAAGATGCPGGTGPKDTHTDCQGPAGIGHNIGKQEAKTNCTTCHGADLGKAAGDNCFGCHNPTATHTVSHGGKMHRPGAASKNSQDPKCINCHAVDQQGLAACSPCHK
jgi:hypothetical protein